MPTYEYRCPQGHDFEVFQRISAEPGALCPQCGDASERRISGGAGFLFKGEGFYITDSRSDDYKKKASSEQPAAPSTETAKSEGAGKPKESGSGGSSGTSSTSSTSD